jgi:integrase
MVYTAFQRWGMRQDNPAAGVKAPKARESEATNVMQRSISFDQARKLLDYTRAVSERDGALIRLLIFHGLRVGEISRMKRSDLNGNILTIHGKGNKLRLIVLSDSCAKELNLIPDGPMFDNGFGGCLTVRSIERIVNKYFTLCGFKEHGKSVHALRHTSATLAIIGGAKREALAQSLGHASPSTTDHYIRAAASYQDNPVYAVEKALGGVQ